MIMFDNRGYIYSYDDKTKDYVVTINGKEYLRTQDALYAWTVYIETLDVEVRRQIQRCKDKTSQLNRT